MREKHGLKDKTIVIKKSLESFDAKSLDSIRKVFRDYNQINGRFDPEHPPHTSPEYNYLMYCKSFFIIDAITNPLTKKQNLEQILWLDFGYNLGGNTFTCSDEFDFLFRVQDELWCLLDNSNDILKNPKNLETQKSDRLCLFELGNPDTRALPHILISGTQHFFTGCLMYGSATAWQKFNAHMREALLAFLSFNIMDDDQKLAIWCVRNYPKDFQIVAIDGWFHALYYFMPESKRKSISTKIHSLLQESLLPKPKNKKDETSKIETLSTENAKNITLPTNLQSNLSTKSTEIIDSVKLPIIKRIVRKIKQKLKGKK